MFFASTLIFGHLLASAVLAVPSSHYGACVTSRRDGGRSRVNNRIAQSSSAVSEISLTSVNWAGAFWDKDNGTFTSVTGTFTAPTLFGKDGTVAFAWVGIDGDTCEETILQTGVDFTLSNGHVSYDAWYEWYPAFSADFTPIHISPGDTIKLTVTAHSSTSGDATVVNLTNGQMVSKNLTSTSPLCQQNAEWVVEDFEIGGAFAPFANFSTVTFTNAKAIGNGTYTPYGATVVNIEHDGQILTSVSVGEASVTISHV